ncbi:MAG: hypothetical protein M0P63_15320 [Azoarcus sp.]|nr:hypothetical protein [Azoarcus sp.]
MMQPDTAPALSLEWSTLQDNHERYERGLLWLKLVSVVLSAIAFVSGNAAAWMAFLVAVLWGQEAIFRTFQARLAARLLRLEALMREGAGSPAACQLHSEWEAGRGGTLGLVAEYARSALRPTVAFPHAVLVLALLGMSLLA